MFKKGDKVVEINTGYIWTFSSYDITNHDIYILELPKYSFRASLFRKLTPLEKLL